MSIRACAYCGGKDHIIDYCPKTAQGQSNRHILKCSYCGSNMHNRDACPKCWPGKNPVKIVGTIILSFLLSSSLMAQVSGISTSAFGARTWRECVAASSNLPTSNNRVCDIRATRDSSSLWIWTSDNVWVELAGAGEGLQGLQGIQGVPGEQGIPGVAAVVSIGAVTTLSPGLPASVVNSGTEQSAVFDFGIPRGNDGTDGINGTNGTNGSAATVSVGTVTTGASGSSASVVNIGSSEAAILNFSIPKGDQGQAGIVSATSPLALSSGVLSIGAFPAGSSASLLGLRIGSSSGFWEVSPGDFLLATGSPAKNIVEFNYGNSTSAFFQSLQAPNFKLDPSQNPPFACDSSKRGFLYYDDNTNSFCGCTGAAWLPILGAGPCA